MNELLSFNCSGEHPIVLDRNLYVELINCNSFEYFFIVVCREKVSRNREELDELVTIVSDDYFKIKYGLKAIMYLQDCITTEKVLPFNLSGAFNHCELNMQNEIIKNFSNLFPDMVFVGKEIVVKGIGRIDILARKGDRYVIIELKCGSKNPNAQLLAYANNYNSPILIGITEIELNDSQKLNNIEYFTFEELKKKVDLWIH